MAEKILIIEDDYSFREALEDALSEAGYAVVTAQDAETGMLLFEAESPGLAVLDMTLPRMSGTHFCELIRQSPTIPVIMFTGHNEVQLVSGAITRGATDYVLKESGVLELITRIGRHLSPKTATAVIAAALAQKRRLPTMIADPDPDSRDKLLAAVKRLNYVDAQETEDWQANARRACRRGDQAGAPRDRHAGYFGFQVAESSVRGPRPARGINRNRVPKAPAGVPPQAAL